jgi:D-alanyl-D-alanine carboxypeptidase (penicillin-binding protein 5/6)
MTPDEPAAPSRRALRDRGASGAVTGEFSAAQDASGTDTPAAAAPASTTMVQEAPAASVTSTLPAETAPAGPGVHGTPEPSAPPSRRALSWVSAATLAALRRPDPAPDQIPDLLGRPPRRSPMRPGVVIPTLVIAGLVGVYSAGTLLWPLHEVAPTIEPMTVQAIPAPAASPAWPAVGTAAVSVGGISGAVASSADTHSIASITKVVTALAVLEEMPLARGEQGPEFRFGFSDRASYWNYRANGESALDVPVGGTLTQYQLLEGMLIGSANNYADRLAGNLWPTDAVYASAANDWLTTHGVRGVRVVDPAGIEAGNTATPEALLVLAQKALAHPVVAEIVAKKSVELPGAGLVRNTNGLLADPGVVGVKTGTLDTWNLLSAKDVVIGEETVRLYASVLGQRDDAARIAASRALFTQLESELQLAPSIARGTQVGTVVTDWGETAPVITTVAASVVLWNGGAANVSTAFDLGDARARGQKVGTLTADGPLDTATVDLRLGEKIDDPSPWWRLTHPLELLGLDD